MPDVYSRFVQPETVRLELSRGDWIVVRKRLNKGEHHKMLARTYKPATVSGNGRDPAIQLDPIAALDAAVLAYLLDWSFVRPDGTAVVIRGKSLDEVAAALDALDFDSFEEIRRAIERHVDTIARELEDLKANPFGDHALSLTS